jgi:hypothetical protein
LRPKVVVTGGVRGAVARTAPACSLDVADGTRLTRGFMDAFGVAGTDEQALSRLRAAHAAREPAWVQLVESGRPLPPTRLGRRLPGFVRDIDATQVLCHSEKESASRADTRHPVDHVRPLPSKSAPMPTALASAAGATSTLRY